jgi:hypothetical protein
MLSRVRFERHPAHKNKQLIKEIPTRSLAVKRWLKSVGSPRKISTLREDLSSSKSHGCQMTNSMVRSTKAMSEENIDPIGRPRESRHPKIKKVLKPFLAGMATVVPILGNRLDCRSRFPPSSQDRSHHHQRNPKRAQSSTWSTRIRKRRLVN